VCSLWRIFIIQRNDVGGIHLLTGLLLMTVLYGASVVRDSELVMVKQHWSGDIRNLIGLLQFPL
jgi:hypothetical protein